MSGHRKFSELTANFSPERQAEIAQKTDQLKDEIALQEVQNTVSPPLKRGEEGS